MNRICPFCQQRVSMQEHTCPDCGYALINQNLPACTSIVRPSNRPMSVRVETAIEIDRTGSSVNFEKGIHQSVEFFLEQLSQQVSAVDVWVGSHGDLDYGENPIMHLESGTPQQAVSEIKAITFEGGGDAPEHHLDGIATLLQQVPWSCDPMTRKVMVCLANDVSKPAQCGMTASQIGQQIKSLGILFYLICEPCSELQQVVDAAGGMVIPISNDPDVDELKGAISSVSRSLTATITSGATIPMIVS